MAPAEADTRRIVVHVELRLLLEEGAVLHQAEGAGGVGRLGRAAALRAHAPVLRPHEAEAAAVLADAARGLEAPALGAARGARRDVHVRGGPEAVLPRQALRVLVPVVRRVRVRLLVPGPVRANLPPADELQRVAALLPPHAPQVGVPAGHHHARLSLGGWVGG